MASDDDIAYAGAGALIERYRTGTLSPVEATRALLDRLDRLETRINAFVAIDREGALEAARRSEARWRGGAAVGRLDGVPVTIKDLVLTRGMPTLRGSRLVEKAQHWGEDAPATARLREAGAVIVGKTTTPEFGWKAIGDSPLTGITRNPWNLAHTPGGSSAGAAASCAAGIGPLHIGTDGAGSIRIPASFTGIFGLKPSFGRVPAYPPSPMGQLSHVGPMAREVRDAALMLGVLSGADDRDPYALPPERLDYQDGIEGGVRGWRVGFSPDLGYARVAPEIARAVAAAVERFAALGAIVEEVKPIFTSPREALMTLWAAGTVRIVGAVAPARRALFDPGLLAVARAGLALSAADYVAADLVRGDLARQMARFHRSYDLLLTPMMPVPALPVGRNLDDPAVEREWVDWSPFSYPFNLTRQPAASISCGLTQSGLPIGLQIVGPLYGDARVLRAARAFETTEPFRRPPLE